MKKLIIFFITLTLLTACGEKKIDASSPESFKYSVQAIAKDLNGADLEAFQQAVIKISLVSSIEAKGNDAILEKILKNKLDGKTAAEVILIAKHEKNPFNMNKLR